MEYELIVEHGDSFTPAPVFLQREQSERVYKALKIQRNLIPLIIGFEIDDNLTVVAMEADLLVELMHNLELERKSQNSVLEKKQVH